MILPGTTLDHPHIKAIHIYLEFVCACMSLSHACMHTHKAHSFCTYMYTHTLTSPNPRNNWFEDGFETTNIPAVLS